MNILDLPIEIIEHVISFVSILDLATLCKTCKLFRQLMNYNIYNILQNLDDHMKYKLICSDFWFNRIIRYNVTVREFAHKMPSCPVGCNEIYHVIERRFVKAMIEDDIDVINYFYLYSEEKWLIFLKMYRIDVLFHDVNLDQRVDYYLFLPFVLNKKDMCRDIIKCLISGYCSTKYTGITKHFESKMYSTLDAYIHYYFLGFKKVSQIIQFYDDEMKSLYVRLLLFLVGKVQKCDALVKINYVLDLFL